MTKPKLLFVYDHPHPEMWLDGLSAALDLLEEDFDISRFNFGGSDDEDGYSASFRRGKYDFILAWGAFGSRPDKFAQGSVGKKGLCVAGNALVPFGANSYDVLFYETDWIKNNYLPEHPNMVKAFGVNTDIYFPFDMPTTVVWDFVAVGALASWKRFEKMKEKKGMRLVIGEYQLGNEQESLSIARDLLVNGVMVSNMVTPYELALVYQCSRTLYMPSTEHGGGERSVIEARSCGLSVQIEPDNLKLKELVEMEKIPSHFDYAKALKEGILSVI